MNKLITFLVFSISLLSNAQQKITFEYDGAGNQVLRELCLSGCNPLAKQTKEIETIVEEDLQKFFPTDAISYYPNPVREELYLKWELFENNAVSLVSVYGLNGQVLKTYAISESTNALNISFSEYSRGVYIVALNYKNGDQKTIKIIKQ